jgi:hypothetical protein
MRFDILELISLHSLCLAGSDYHLWKFDPRHCDGAQGNESRFDIALNCYRNIIGTPNRLCDQIIRSIVYRPSVINDRVRVREQSLHFDQINEQKNETRFPNRQLLS